MPTILEDMGLTPDQAGSFFLVSASGYCVALLCSGFVSSRFLHVKTIVFSAIATGLMMVLTGLVYNLALMRCTIFAAGMAAGLYLPSGIAILTTTVAEKNWGKAMGIHELAPNVSFLLAPILCEVLLLWMSWRQVLFCVGTASIGMGIVFSAVFPDPGFCRKGPEFQGVRSPGRHPFLLVHDAAVQLRRVRDPGDLCHAAAVSGERTRHGPGPGQHPDHPVPGGHAAHAPGDRLGRRPVRPESGAGHRAGGERHSGVGYRCVQWIFLQAWVFCQPVVAVCFFPPAFAALSHIGSKEMRNVAVSFTIPAAFLVGGGLVPHLIGIPSEFAESIINTVREPLIALDQDLRVVTVSRSFYEVFKVNPEETVGQLIYDLGNKQWDIPKLRELLETILPQKTTFDDYEVEHDFADIGRRIMLLNARQIKRVLGKKRIILLAIEDITERSCVILKSDIYMVDKTDLVQCTIRRRHCSPSIESLKPSSGRPRKWRQSVRWQAALPMISIIYLI
jgi:MFS transporter, NNP family, nitrate/nitrite transporter